MTTKIKTKVKVYQLTIPRAQYDRLASAFDSMVDEEHFVKYSSDEDTVTFRVPENLRLRFVKHAKNPGSRKFWITQMFLPKNIEPYLVTN